MKKKKLFKKLLIGKSKGKQFHKEMRLFDKIFN